MINQALGRVQAQSIEVEFIDPIGRVVRDQPSDGGAVCAVEVHGSAPFVVLGRKVVRREAIQIVAVWTQVIVDDVQDHPDSQPVGLIDKRSKIVWKAVQVRRREPRDAIVSPAKSAGKFADRHQFNHGDAQLPERLQARARSLPCSLGAEGSDMKLVDDLPVQRQPRPRKIGPREPPRLHDLRRTVWAVGQEPGRGIGQARFVAIDAISVAHAHARFGERQGPVAVGLLKQRKAPRAVGQQELHPLVAGRPYTKMHAARDRGGSLGQ